MEKIRDILKDGMVVKFDDGEFGLVLNEKILTPYQHVAIDNLDEYGQSWALGCSIAEIYGKAKLTRGDMILDLANHVWPMSPLWIYCEEEREIDYNNLNEFTKIEVRDDYDEEWRRGYYLEYIDEVPEYKHRITFRDRFTYEDDNESECFRYCRLYKEEN